MVPTNCVIVLERSSWDKVLGRRLEEAQLVLSSDGLLFGVIFENFVFKKLAFVRVENKERHRRVALLQSSHLF